MGVVSNTLDHFFIISLELIIDPLDIHNIHTRTICPVVSEHRAAVPKLAHMESFHKFNATYIQLTEHAKR